MSKKDPEDFRKILEGIARRKSDLLSVFRDFCRMAACSLAAGGREEEYLEVARGYEREELDKLGKALGCLVEEMEANPFQDILGVYYMDVGARSVMQERGEFFTPQCVSEMMAKMLVQADQVIAEGRPITVSDPASGSGGIILSVAKEFAPEHVDLLRVTCQDISPLSCDMCYINMTLWGIPARIIWGDTLRATVEKSWCNIHWFRVGEDQLEKWRQIMGFFSEAPSDEKGGSDEEAEIAEIVIPSPEKRAQLSFDFESS